MSENEYVATAAAEKRLREVLTDRLPEWSTERVDDLAVVMLDSAKIEYKPRTKQVLISLTVPETAATRSASRVKRQDGSDPTVTAPDGTPIGSDDGSTGSAEYGAPPQPHIAPFQPREFEPTEDDAHFD